MGSADDLEKEIPVWIRLPAGFFLGLIALFSIAGSVTLLIAPPPMNPNLSFMVGLILIIVSLWVLEKCIRMVFGFRNQGGLLSPKALRIVSVLLLLLPVAGIFTGYYGEKGIIAILQAIAYVGIFIGLNVLASRRNLRNEK